MANETMASDPSSIIALIPGLNPPPGTHSNFDNPPSLSQLVRILMSLSLALMLIFVAVRVYTRSRVTYSFGTDDVLCIVSALTIIAYTGVIFSKLDNPLGPHQWDIPLIELGGDLIKVSVIGTSLYAVAAAFLKAALLILYRRIFRPSYLASIIIWVSLAAIVTYYVITIFFIVGTCGPHIYDSNIPDIDPATFDPVEFAYQFAAMQLESPCSTPQINNSIAMSVFGVISDFGLLALPIAFTLQIQLPRAKKAGVCAIFLTGLLACVASVVAMYYRFKVRSSPDFTWYITLAYMVTAIEINIGIICSCMPIVPITARLLKTTPLWGSMVKLLSSNRRKQSYPTTEISDVHQDAEIKGKLPQVPRGAITGLRSFIRHAHRSRSGHTELTNGSDDTELLSRQDHYHAHLQKTPSK